MDGQLDPDLDLWKTAKPFLEDWMDRQVGVRGMINRFQLEAVNYGQILPQLPRLLAEALKNVAKSDNRSELLDQLIVEQKKINGRLNSFLYFAGGLLFGILLVKILFNWRFFL